MSRRPTHIVDIDKYDLDMAIALQLEVVGDCGATFVPRVVGSGADRFPECPDCFPRSRRGKHRTSVAERQFFPHYVYRCFDATGQLLYVGCTYNPAARPRQHRAEKREWVDMVTRTKWTVWPNRRKALDMERLAIETERPIYNKTFNREAS